MGFDMPDELVDWLVDSPYILTVKVFRRDDGIYYRVMVKDELDSDDNYMVMATNRDLDAAYMMLIEKLGLI